MKADQLTPYRTGERSPVASSVGPRGDLLLARQLADITRAARSLGVNPDAICKNELRCEASDLTREAAADFIEFLKGKGATV